MAELSTVIDGIHRIETYVSGTRMPLALFLMEAAGGAWLLTDTGCVGMVTELVLPALARLRSGAVIGTGVVCHAHADHFGGNAELLAANPACRILAHRDDVAWARDPAWHVSDAYDRLEPDYSTPAQIKDWVLGLLGPPAPVETLETGDELPLADGRNLRVLHLPGHSPGHIGLWDGELGVLLASDAILGDGQWADGRLVAIPSYLDVGWYLGSIRTIRALGASVLATAHYPLLRDEQVAAFCDRSQDFVGRLDAAVREALTAAGPRSLRELTHEVVPRVAPGVAPSMTAALSVQAHLDDLRVQGMVQMRVRGEERLWDIG